MSTGQSGWDATDHSVTDHSFIGRADPSARMLSARRPLLLISGLLALISVGLPWSAGSTGGQHPMRALLALSAPLLCWALSRGLQRVAWAALGLAALALPMMPTGDTLQSGRLVYALAILVAAVAVSVGARHREREPGS
jgi:hypothetical protein